MEAYQQAASSNNQYLNIISDHIKELDKDAKGKSISCIDQTCPSGQNDSSSEKESDESSNESEAALRVVEDTFEESGPLTINKLHQWKRVILVIISLGQHHLISNLKREALFLPLPLTANPFTNGTLMANPNMKFFQPYKKFGWPSSL